VEALSQKGIKSSSVGELTEPSQGMVLIEGGKRKGWSIPSLTRSGRASIMPLRITNPRGKMMGTEKQNLDSCRVIAVVGISPNPDRPSHKVARYLKENGYRIVPVNPTAGEILDETCYPDLVSIPEPVDVVDIFRRSEEVSAIVKDAIKIAAKAVWMQEGISNEEAATRARAAGLLVVMDRCMLKEHQKLRNSANK